MHTRAQRLQAIEAIFFSTTSGPEEINHAKAVRAQLVEHYGLQDQIGAPPLLLLDLHSGGDSPFSVPTKAWLERLRD